MNLPTQSKGHRLPAGSPSRCPSCLPLPAPQPSSSRRRNKLTAKVANPRHNDGNDARNDGTGSWDDGKSAAESAQDTPNVALGVDWAKVQNLAALVGAATLGAVVTLQLTGKADLQSIAYQSIPEPLQEALPQLGGDTNKGPLPQFEVGAVVQNFQAPSGADRQKAQEKVRAERQQNFDKSKQQREAKTEQNKKDRQQRQKQKEREKDEADRKEKEQKEKERKEKEKRKKFKEQALMGGSIFGVSALTFGKWQLFASLGAVVFRTIGGPTLLSSVLRTPGYIIGRGVRVVEWDVSESPSGPTGHLVSMKLRALTPDGIRIAIAKEYGLSNYREVRQVSHWVTTTTPYFFEPMRTAATFKMLPDPAFVVWSKHPPTGSHTLPTRSSAASTADSTTQHPLDGLAADQVTAVMLKAISGVAAASRHNSRAHARQTAGDNGSSQRANGNGLTQAVCIASDRDSGSGESEAHDITEAGKEAGQSSRFDAQEARLQGNGGASMHVQSHAQQAAHNHGQTHTDAHDGNENAQTSLPGSQASPKATLTGHQQSNVSVASRQEVEEGISSGQTESSGSNGSSPQAASQSRSSESGTEAHVQAPAQQFNADSSKKRSFSGEAVSKESAADALNADDQRSSQEKNARDGQERSGDNEVAGALQDESDADRQVEHSESKEPKLWNEPSVLQCLCDSPGASANTWGEKLKLAVEFGLISEEEEDCLVLAGCKHDGNMLSLFRAYAPHNILTFVRFARLYCSEM